MLKKWIVPCVAALACVGAFADPELAEIGVDVGDYVTLAITALGTTVALVVGGFFAFLLIRKGMSWGKRAL